MDSCACVPSGERGRERSPWHSCSRGAARSGESPLCGRVSGGPQGRRGPAEQLPEEPLPKQRPGSVGAGEARMTRALSQSTFSGEEAGEPFCTFRKRLGFKGRETGRWRVWDAGTASALMGGLRMGRRGQQGGETRGAVTGVEGLRRREEAGVRVQLKREEDTVPPSGTSQPGGGTETKLSPRSSTTDPKRG